MAMQRSASEPVLRQEDYYVPSNGVGETGLPPRVTYGPMSKDKGTFSSRINTIIRQAEKVPGPGKYLAHTDWTLNKGSRFAKTERAYKPLNKVPSPTEYERKDIFDKGYRKDQPVKQPIAAKDCLSHITRAVFGKISKAKKRSFIDMSIAHAAKMPGPYDTKCGLCDRLDVKTKGSMNWAREVGHTERRGNPSPPSLAPNHYTVNYSQIGERSPNYSVPKEKAANFLDKVAQEAMIPHSALSQKDWEEKYATKKGSERQRYVVADPKFPKKDKPGPGMYDMQNYDLSKTSRGTTHLQMRGLGRNALSGYL